MAKFCAWCGKPIDDGDVFCAHCGKRADGSDAAVQQPQQPVRQPAAAVPPAAPSPTPQPQQQWQAPAQPQQPQWQPPATPPQHAKQGGGKGGLIAGIIAAVVVVAVLVGGFVWPGFFKKDKKASNTPSIPGTEATPTPAPKETKSPKATETPKETEVPKPIATPAPTPAPTPEPTEPPYVNTFTDVSEGDWYYDAVMWAGKNGIVSGTEFKPGDNATRAQALTFIWRAAGSPAPNLKVSPYSDVSEGDWYYQPVLWGFENGLISTSADGQSHAGDNLTRAQAVTFLCRAKGGKPQSSQRRFWDAAETDWYFDQANWALEQGIIGCDDRYTFNPNGTETRASLLTLLYRAYDPDAKKASTTPPNKSSFADLGLPADDVDIFGPKYYNTVTKSGKPITYSAVVTDYRVFEEADGYPKWDGYAYRIMTVEITQVSESDGSGTIHSVLYSDYYNDKLFEASEHRGADGVYTFTVLCDGKLTDCTIWHTSESISGGLRITCTVSAPKGYDGVVFGVKNNSIPFGSNYLHEIFTSTADFAMFRMYNLE